MAKVASRDQCSILVVVIMSHGTSGMIVGTDGQEVPVEDILKFYKGDVCPGMAGCPKVFIFQCCRNC